MNYRVPCSSLHSFYISLLLLQACLSFFTESSDHHHCWQCLFWSLHVNSELFTVLLAFHSFPDLLIIIPSIPDLLPAALLCIFKLSSMFHSFFHLFPLSSTRTFDNSGVLIRLPWTCSSANILSQSLTTWASPWGQPTIYIVRHQIVFLVQTFPNNCFRNLKEKILKLKTFSSKMIPTFLFLMNPQNCWRILAAMHRILFNCSTSSILSSRGCFVEKNGPASYHLQILHWSRNQLNALCCHYHNFLETNPLWIAAVPRL